MTAAYIRPTCHKTAMCPFPENYVSRNQAAFALYGANPMPGRQVGVVLVP